ncbi:MAG: hypothetical protein KGI94_02195 [Paracoccaceae bacterium]|nr:hypothetical protein [Paracoccaceae bacterium]
MIKQNETEPLPICGIVMPISAIDGCDERHWKDVLEVHSDAIKRAKMQPSLVSDSQDTGVIQKRIVQNLYNNKMVLCDISGKNPNVMLELGMRLAFDKPVVIVKDDQTPYSFDTSPVYHLTYPRDLRFQSILEFQRILAEKIIEAARNHNSFLSSFGTFKVATIDEEKAEPFEILSEQISELRSSVSEIASYTREQAIRTHNLPRNRDLSRLIGSNTAMAKLIAKGDRKSLERFENFLRSANGTISVQSRPISENEIQFSMRRKAHNGTLQRYIFDAALAQGVEITLYEEIYE